MKGGVNMTQNIDNCLRCIEDIDTQTLYAEGKVMEACLVYNTKSDTMLLLEANDASNNKPPAIVRMIEFIKKCINKMIDKFSDILVKMKGHKAEYIKIPCDVGLLIDDMNLIEDLEAQMKEMLAKRDATKDFSPEEIKQLSDINNRAVFNINHVNNKGKTHALPKEKWFKLRDQIRNNLKELKETKTLLDRNEKKYIGHPKVEALHELTSFYTKATNAAMKIMSSFTFSGMNVVNATKEQVKQASPMPV